MELVHPSRGEKRTLNSKFSFANKGVAQRSQKRVAQRGTGEKSWQNAVFPQRARKPCRAR
jgi:hypothetical protein